MLKKIFLKSCFVAFASTSFVFAKDATSSKEGFRVPRSTLEAIERKLKVETDPYKRIQLLLRWVKNKEEYEQSVLEKKQDAAKKPSEKGKPESSGTATAEEVGAFRGYKEVIIDRVEKEIEDLAGKPGVKDSVGTARDSRAASAAYSHHAPVSSPAMPTTSTTAATSRTVISSTMRGNPERTEAMERLWIR